MTTRRLLLSAVLMLAALPGVNAAETRLTVWQLPLGRPITAMPPANKFSVLACGSNGGPPLQRLTDWSQYSLCTPEAGGLREVYLEYNDSAEQAARTARQYLDLGQVGTAEAYFPVVASALFDATGVLRGIRLVTDPRPDARQASSVPRLRPRGEHYLMAGYLAARFGITDSDCLDIVPAEGESPVIGQFVKRDCAKTIGNIHYRLEQRYLRKRGQSDIDPDTGQLSVGQFESWARFEMDLL